jgi:hypothetical protein
LQTIKNKIHNNEKVDGFTFDFQKSDDRVNILYELKGISYMLENYITAAEENQTWLGSVLRKDLI